MALDRQSIVKNDFPIGRRGYDPDAVDGHLATVASEVESLRRQASERSGDLSAVAADQVRTIVEAAEASAGEIARQAESDAHDVRTSANAEARASREQATEQARDYVSKVAEASTSLLQRVDAMESELATLVDELRTGANRLNADLQLLQGNLSEVSDATGVGRRFQPEDGEPAAGLGGEEEELVLEEVEVEVAEVGPEDQLGPLPDPDAVEDDDDAEGARLVALNMALNGSSRQETDRYLAEHYTLEDRASLLDEVYATVEG